jgi:hypothetical protein
MQEIAVTQVELAEQAAAVEVAVEATGVIVI